jgi:ATP-dependent protease ClpP protease subunit
MTRFIVFASVLVLGAGLEAGRADILVTTDGQVREAKVVRQNAKEVVVQADPSEPQKVEHIDAKTLSRVILTDEHGAVLPGKPGTTQPAKVWKTTTAPAVLPVKKPSGKPTYYLIPLHGEVGATVVADILEKSLKDAVERKSSVVVLDIDSPGGDIEETQKILKVLHKYNKQLRIVALTDKDLSAAAIITLSLKEIYTKSTSTIGAATAYQITRANLAAPLAEKMMSAWRAVARNSAEEGGHEPLLAEAMIDSDLALYMEMADGRPIISTERGGRHDTVLCQRGKILTLTSHEAVTCGLAKALADDCDELGTVLEMPGWTECKGMGTALADYQANQVKLLTDQIQEIGHQFDTDIKEAAAVDPSAGTYLSRITTSYGPLQPGIPMPGYPGRPAVPGPGMPRVPTPGVPRYPTSPTGTVSQRVTQIVPPETRVKWMEKSLACVVALQRAEHDIADMFSLCKSFGHELQSEVLTNLQTELGAVRTRVYEDRNKYNQTPTSGPTRTPATKPAP